MPEPQGWEATLYEYSDDYEIEAGHASAESLTATGGVNGRFNPEPVAQATEDVIAACRDENPFMLAIIRDRLARLDAARGAC